MIKNFEYYEERDYNSLAGLTQQKLKNYMAANNNKYCFFDVSVNGEVQEKIIFELFNNKCPLTSNNFLSICRGIKATNSNELISYQNSLLDRIVKNGYIQGGDLSHLRNGK